MKIHLSDLCVSLFVILLSISSGATLCFQVTGSTLDPVEKIQRLKSEDRRDEALDLFQFYRDNGGIDQHELEKLEDELEYSTFEKGISLLDGAVTGRIHDTYSGLGAIGSDLCIIGDIRDLGLQSWLFFKDEDTDAIVGVLSGLGIALSVTPYTDVLASYAKNTVKYLRKISGLSSDGWIVQYLLKGRLSLDESKKLYQLFKSNGFCIPRTASLLSYVRNTRYLELVTDLVSRFKRTGRAFVSITGDAGLFLYEKIPKPLTHILMKGFQRNPKVILGFTKVHLALHSLKIFKKYNIIGLLVPVMGLSLLLTLLPLWLTLIIFIGSSAFSAVIINRKYRWIKEKVTYVKSNLFSRKPGKRS